MKKTEGHLSAAGLQFAIVISRFNELVTGRLLAGAEDALVRHGADSENIEVIWVPGAFEIPMAAHRAMKKGGYHAIICLGAVIRGDTPHFDFIAAEATKGIAALSLKADIPVTFGLITADTLDQALQRAGSKAGNKGWEAAVSAIEMADLYKKIR